MKKKFTLLFVALTIASATLFTSCKDDDDNGGNAAPARKDFLEATVGGTKYAAGTILATYDGQAKSVSATLSSTDQVTTIGITFVIDQGTTLPMGTSGTTIKATGTYQNGSDVFEAKSGTLVLTKNDTQGRIAEGTFEFEAEDGNGVKKPVTAGKFSLKY